MKINLSENWEKNLVSQLGDFESQFDTATAVKPHDEWSDSGKGPEGVIGEWARNKIVLLTNEDFRQGTIRVIVPCKLVLCESIVFNPNPGPISQGKVDRSRTDDWFPHKNQKAYFTDPANPGPHGTAPSHAFRLGFFAALTIEHGNGTILDLNGFRFSCHPLFALQQRFHAVIELANQPFVPGQGPAAFGNELRSARKVWIKNGEIGRSSHHGIHGNSNQDVYVSDVTFRDYEVAAISLNGGRRILIQDCQLKGTATEVPILGSYSTARFLKLVGEEYLTRVPQMPAFQALSNAKKNQINSELTQLGNSLTDLKNASDDVVDAVLAKKLNTIHPLYQNPPINGERLPDANPYGIAIHSRGVLVNAFLCNGSKLTGLNDLSKAYECADISLKRVNISKVRGNVREVLALASSQYGPAADSAGSLFRFFGLKTQLPGHSDPQIAEMNAQGKPTLTFNGKAQIALASLERKLIEHGVIPESSALTFKLFPFIDWAKNDGSKIVQDPGTPYKFKLKNEEFTLMSNGDSMFHVNKGALGLFIQAVDGLLLDRVVVAVVENKGLPGSDLAGPYQSASNGGHAAQNQQQGYSGCDARGIYLGACSNVLADRIQAHGIVSDYGSSTAIEVGGGTEHAKFISAVAGLTQAGAKFADDSDFENSENKPHTFMERFPNLPPMVIGMKVDATTRNVQIDDFQVTGKLACPVDSFPPKIRLESRLNVLSPSN